MKKNGIKITVLGPGGQSVSVFGRRLDVDSPPWAINDLENQPRDTGEALGAMKMVLCLDNLEGETVYLVDTGFAGSSAFMKEVRDWFTRNQPSVKTELRHKKTSMFNPMWVVTDFSYFQTVIIDSWIPKAGIKKDVRPLRMPEAVVCKDGSCGISH